MSRIILEGGGDSKELRTRCRKAFSTLFERAGFSGRMPRLVASGGRTAAFDDFCGYHQGANGEYVALLVDSEEPVADVEQPWAHLHARDGWDEPGGASDDQALLMITSMETWIAFDREAVRRRFGNSVKEDRLPPVQNIEARSRASVLAALQSATQDCPAVYSKGPRSFEVLGYVSPNVLMALPGFARVRRVLDARL